MREINQNIDGLKTKEEPQISLKPELYDTMPIIEINNKSSLKKSSIMSQKSVKSVRMDAHHSKDSIHSINDDGHEEPLIFGSMKGSIIDSNRSWKNYKDDSIRNRKRTDLKGLQMESDKKKEKKRAKIALTKIKIN